MAKSRTATTTSLDGEKAQATTTTALVGEKAQADTASWVTENHKLLLLILNEKRLWKQHTHFLILLIPLFLVDCF